MLLAPGSRFRVGLRSGLTGQSEPLNASIPEVRDVQVALPIERQVPGILELAARRAGRSPFGQRLPGRRQLLDAVVAGVRNVDVTGSVYGDAPGMIELPGTVAAAAPLCHQLAARRELLDAVAARIRQVNVTLGIEGQGEGSGSFIEGAARDPAGGEHLPQSGRGGGSGRRAGLRDRTRG